LRKLTVLLSCLLVLSVILAGCSGKADKAGTESKGDGKTLTAWAWNINIPVLEKAEEEFAKEHPGFTLKITEIGTPDVYKKITTSLQAGGKGLPDIMLVEDDRVQGYLNSFPKAFMNVTEKGFDKQEEKFPDFKKELLSVDGNMYGFPFDAGPTGIFYRTDLFKEAGIDANTIETWDDFVEAGKVLKKKTGVALTGIDVNGDDGIYRAMLNQQGTFYFDKEGNIDLTSDASKKAMDVIQKITDADLNNSITGWDGWISALANGKVATAPSGGWLTGSLMQQAPDLEGKWGVIQLPAMEAGGNRAANWGGSNYMISAKSPNADLAYDFMEYFSTSDEVQQSAMEGGLFPSLNTLYGSETFKEPVSYFGGQQIWTLFADEMADIPYANYSHNYAVGRDEATKALSQISSGTDVEKALKEAAGRLDNRMKK